MIVPVVLNLESFSDYDHQVLIYYYLSALRGQEKRAMISHESYFMTLEQAELVGITKSKIAGVGDLLEFNIPTDASLEQVGKYTIPQLLEAEIIAQFDCQLSAWPSLLKENHPLFLFQNNLRLFMI